MAVIGWGSAFYALLLQLPFDASRPRPFIDQTLSWQENRDPKLGEALPGIASFLRNRADTKNLEGKIVLVALGSCDSCSARKFDSQSSLFEGFRLVQVVEGDSVGRETDVRGKPKPRDERFQFELPPADYAKLQATWTPRYYVCDGGGVLLASQKPSERVADFLMRCRK